MEHQRKQRERQNKTTSSNHKKVKTQKNILYKQNLSSDKQALFIKRSQFLFLHLYLRYPQRIPDLPE